MYYIDIYICTYRLLSLCRQKIQKEINDCVKSSNDFTNECFSRPNYRDDSILVLHFSESRARS